MTEEKTSPAPGTERVINGLHELTVDVSASPLANADILPVPVRERTWNTWNMASLWVGIAVCIPTYMLAASLIAAGMNWTQAIWTILLGNAIVLIPLCLNAYPGTKYGIPFPVLIRSSFGTRGAQIPSILRGLVACGWFGIQTWIGGKAIYELAKIPLPGIAGLFPGLRESFVGINGGELVCFLAFWLLHMIIVWKGTESIKWFESLAAPALILVGIALLIWAIRVGGGLGNVLDKSECFVRPTLSLEAGDGVVVARLDPLRDENGRYRPDRMRLAVAPAPLNEAVWEPFQPEFEIPWEEGAAEMKVQVEIGVAADEEAMVALSGTARRKVAPPPGPWAFTVFFPLLTAMVGYWATLSLNIPDFTRYAKSQKDQILGQAIGLPTTMTLYAFVGVVATCASLIAFPRILAPESAPWDPVALLAYFRIPWMLILSMAILALATLTTNIAANVVAPANGFSNLSPTKISFRMGGLITGLIGIVMMPWKLLANVGAYIFTWLIGYSALMGGVAGVMIADFYLVRKRKLDLEGLYKVDGPYTFSAGFNWAGIVAFVLGVLPNIPGFLVQVDALPAEMVPAFFRTLYTYAWFTSFAIAFVVYSVWMRAKPDRTT
jgi:cytosine/uracil/thiamine/allantoin permease